MQTSSSGSNAETNPRHVNRLAEPVEIDLNEGRETEPGLPAPSRLGFMLNAFRDAWRERSVCDETEIVIDRLIDDTGPRSLRADLARGGRHR